VRGRGLPERQAGDSTSRDEEITVPESTSRPSRRRLTAVDVERLENTSLVTGLGLVDHVDCAGCTVATCIGVSCTGGGQCVTGGPCLVMTVPVLGPCVGFSGAA
jgi:hypothetical protein